MIERCKSCEGTGVKNDTTCPSCDGSGYTGTQWNERLGTHTVDLKEYLIAVEERDALECELDNIDTDELEAYHSAKEARMAMYDR